MEILIQAFIVRPFGIKLEVDFDKVEQELIQPALKAIGIADGGTTGKILEAGNIRADMFSQLLTADLVVADISIHNANVFYELGVRHALRDKKTFLIRCSKEEVPFDIKTDRYLVYDKDNPSASLNALINGLKATFLSDKQDSPVFYTLPKLQEPNVEDFLAVPSDFGEEVEIARADRQTGKLALLAAEVEGFSWQIPAFRVIGGAQLVLKDYEDAQITWEKIRSRKPNDSEANYYLATIYQRLADEEMSTSRSNGWQLLAQSDIAINRLIEGFARVDRSKRAEIYSQRASNAKTRWIYSWKNVAEEGRRKKALQSSYLIDAYEDYQRAFNEDLNHYYSGINALGLLNVLISLAEALPDVWDAEYDSTEEAKNCLEKYKDQYQKLTTILQVSIDEAKKRIEKEGKKDPWIDMTKADFACLNSKRPQRVSSLYNKVIDQANDLNFDAAKRQLQIYEQLSVQPENVKAGLEIFSNAKIFEIQTKQYNILFTGHMIDKPERLEQRFPPAKEEVVKAAIKEAMVKEKQKNGDMIKGIAGGACGGDILFHEVCEELEIPTEMHLALPREQYLVESVQFAGPQWVERFDRLYKKLPKKILSQTKELPTWLEKNKVYSIWERSNLWMLYSALNCGGINMALVALWDCKESVKPGGTKDMVDKAGKRGSKTIIIDINNLF